MNTTVHYINLIWVTKLQNLSQLGQRYTHDFQVNVNALQIVPLFRYFFNTLE